MKFDVVVGNPPYQGDGKQQIYTDFYLLARNIANEVDLIFPTGWQKPTNANNLGKLNKTQIKHDSQIVHIDNRHNVFEGVAGAEWTNVILWKKGFDNGLNGKQIILTNGVDPKEVRLATDKSEIEKPAEIQELAQLVANAPGFRSVQKITSVLKPYGLRTDVVKDPSKYNLPPILDARAAPDDYELWTGGRSGRVIKYVPHNYPFPTVGAALHHYKIFVPYAWGNWSETSGLGGAFSDIIIAYPEVATTETWLEQGSFETLDLAKKHAKYMLTKFFRALLYMNKHSQHSTTAWGAIPVQDFSEPWWEESISELETRLFDKYNIPQNVRSFVLDNFQTKDESNIINF